MRVVGGGVCDIANLSRGGGVRSAPCTVVSTAAQCRAAWGSVVPSWCIWHAFRRGGCKADNYRLEQLFYEELPLMYDNVLHIFAGMYAYVCTCQRSPGRVTQREANGER